MNPIDVLCDDEAGVKMIHTAWRGLLRLLNRGWEVVPLTSLGLVLGALATIVHLQYGRGAADYVLFAAGALIAGLVTLCALTVAVGAVVLWWRLRPEPAHIPEGMETGVRQRTGLSLADPWWLPFLQLEVDWISPDSATVVMVREGGRLHEEVTPLRRGQHSALTRRFVIGDLFGLSRIALRRQWPHPVRVLPAHNQARMARIVRQASGDGVSHPAGRAQGDLLELRRYAPGDPMRHILWKTFARTRRLMVRTPERAIAVQPSIAAYLVVGPHDEPAASTARTFVEEGLLGQDWTFAAEGGRGIVRDADDAVDQIVASVAHREQGGQGLGPFARQVDAASLDGCVLFVPSSPGPWLDRVAGFVQRLRLPPLVIVTVEGQLERGQAGRLARMMWRSPAPDPRCDLVQVPHVWRRLVQLGCDVRVLHAESGKVLGAEGVEALGTL